MPLDSIAGANIVLGVTGGIAAYKAVELLRLLEKQNAVVTPVLTKGATRFVSELTFNALCSTKAYSSLIDYDEPILHTKLGKNADLILVAPATARLIGTYAAGIASDLLTSVLIATNAPVIVCPAMHTEMYENVAVQENLATLKRRKVIVVDSEYGRLAQNDVGKGRLASLDTILAVVKRTLMLRTSLSDKTVTVTAGGTKEYVDPVRFISNKSSGKQGIAIALEAYYRGATVNLVSTVVGIPDYLYGLENFNIYHVETAQQMSEKVIELSHFSNLVIMAAAVADFRVANESRLKIHRQEGTPKLELVPTVDIISELVTLRSKSVTKNSNSIFKHQKIIGFAAETDNLDERALAKLKNKNVDFLVANDVSKADIGFDSDLNAVSIYNRGGLIKHVAKKNKHEVAAEILDVYESEI